MSDATEVPSVGAAPVSAGRLVREARQARGLHIATLANITKVAPHKLEALESDRYGELPDATFTRALAQTVCRSLKIDASPVMALLPPLSGHPLEQLGGGLNTRFRERSGHLDGKGGSSLTSASVWGPALVLMAATAVYVMPSGVFTPPPVQSRIAAGGADAYQTASLSDALPLVAPPATTTAAATETTPGAANDAAAPVTAATQAAPPLEAVAVEAATAPAAAESLLQVQASDSSWVEVIDAAGRTLLRRLLQPGEAVALDGALPLKIRVGNAAATRLVFRGQAMALAPFTHNNLARLELQ